MVVVAAAAGGEWPAAPLSEFVYTTEADDDHLLLLERCSLCTCDGPAAPFRLLLASSRLLLLLLLLLDDGGACCRTSIRFINTLLGYGRS